MVEEWLVECWMVVEVVEVLGEWVVVLECVDGWVELVVVELVVVGIVGWGIAVSVVIHPPRLEADLRCRIHVVRDRERGRRGIFHRPSFKSSPQ